MSIKSQHILLFGLLALLLPLYGGVQVWLLSEPATRIEVRTVTERVPVEVPVEVPVQVQVPVERVVYVPVPDSLIARAAGLEDGSSVEGLGSGPPLSAEELEALLAQQGAGSTPLVAQAGASPGQESAGGETGSAGNLQPILTNPAPPPPAGVAEGVATSPQGAASGASGTAPVRPVLPASPVLPAFTNQSLPTGPAAAGSNQPVGAVAPAATSQLEAEANATAVVNEVTTEAGAEMQAGQPVNESAATALASEPATNTASAPIVASQPPQASVGPATVSSGTSLSETPSSSAVAASVPSVSVARNEQQPPTTQRSPATASVVQPARASSTVNTGGQSVQSTPVQQQGGRNAATAPATARPATPVVVGPRQESAPPPGQNGRERQGNANNGRDGGNGGNNGNNGSPNPVRGQAVPSTQERENRLTTNASNEKDAPTRSSSQSNGQESKGGNSKEKDR